MTILDSFEGASVWGLFSLPRLPGVGLSSNHSRLIATIPTESELSPRSGLSIRAATFSVEIFDFAHPSCTSAVEYNA